MQSAVPLFVACVTVALAVAAARAPALWLSRERPPYALGAIVSLALAIVVAVDVAAAFRFQPLTTGGPLLTLAACGIAMKRRSASVTTGGTRPCPIALLGLCAVAAAAPLLVLPVPLDTDAQGFGMLALAVRDGGTLDTLAPFRPDIGYLYSPGALLIFASLSTLLHAPMSQVLMGASHAAAWLFVWLAWDFGAVLGDSGHAEDDLWPRAAIAAAALSIGLWTALLDSHYTAVFGLVFVLGFFTAFLRYLRTGSRRDLAAAAVLMAAVVVTHADSTMVLGLGMTAIALTGWIGTSRRETMRLFVGLAATSAGALVIVSPWLARVWPLVAAGVRSPYQISASHWRQLLLLNGAIWPLLAALGAVVWPGRRQIRLAMIAWLVLIVDASLLGAIESIAPLARDRVLRFSYPYSIAWHGPIVPYLALGAGAFVWFARRSGRGTLPLPGTGSLAAAAIVAALIAAFPHRLLALTRGRLSLYGAFASSNDVAAMRWIRDHTDSRIRVLNYPGEYRRQRDWEGHWAPVIAERDCVYFRMQPFFASSHALASAYAEQQDFLSFWDDPADPANEQRLRGAGLGYVLVPEWLGDPSSLEHAWRWQPPARLSDPLSAIRHARFLRLVYENGGAQVFEVVSPADAGRAAR